MTASQLIVLLVAFLVIAIDIWALVIIVRAPDLRYRPFWIIGSLIGFIGLNVDWTQPHHIYLTLGITVPVVWATVVGGHMVVRTAFPIVAAVALAEVGRRKTG